MISIKTESANDHQSVRSVAEAAFAASDFGHNGEAGLIDSIRATHRNIVSLVAVMEGTVVGHILFSPVIIRLEERILAGFGFGPMAVHPTHQNQGIGSKLVIGGLDKLASRGAPFSVVAGDPKFYSRFRYLPASDFGVAHGFTGLPQEFFMIRPSSLDSLQGFETGLAFYVPEFGPQHTDEK